jgi:hypothetical protein
MYLSPVLVYGFLSAQAYSVTCVCLWPALSCRCAQTTLPRELSKLDDADNVKKLKDVAENLVSDNSDKTVHKIKIVNGSFETTDTREPIRSALKR